MQYFVALRAGQKRVDTARKYLNQYLEGKAMPALALKTAQGNNWSPVGQESLFAFVDESAGFVLTDTSGYILAIVDSEGYSKSIVQGVTKEQKIMLLEKFADDGIVEYKGKVILPV